MKKNYILLSLLSSVFMFAQYEGFDYAGALSSNGWSAHSGTVGESLPVATASDLGSSLNYPGIVTPKGNRGLITSAQTEDVNLAFTQPATTTAYASFLMKVVDNSTMSVNTLNTTPGYIMHFARYSGEDIGSTGWVSRLCVRKGSSASTFNIGILNTTGGSAGLIDLYGSSTPVEYQVGTTYFVVLKYDMTGTTGQTSIWMNPTVSSEATPNHKSAFGTSAKLPEVASLAFRQSNNAGSVEVDEIRLGKTWEEVVGAAFLATSDVPTKNKALISNTLVKDGFTLLTKNSAKVEIYSLTGSLVKNLTVAPHTNINVSNLMTGTYVVKITEGNEISTVKIIKQ